MVVCLFYISAWSGPKFFKKIPVHKIQIIKAPLNNPLSMPTDAAVGPNGNLYVMDGTKDRVVVFRPDGRFRFSFGSHGTTKGKFDSPLGIAIGNDGLVYIADTGNRRVQIFTANGTFKNEITVPIINSENQPDITDIAVNHEQNTLYMVDNGNHTIRVFDFTLNKFKVTWGKPGKARLHFRFPYLLTVTHDGYLVIVETINTRVQVINKEGKFVSFLGSWGVNPGHFFRPKGAVVNERNVFITDSYLGWIQVFDLKGNFLGLICDADGYPLILKTPTGITFDPKKKRLFIVELKANQICRITLD